MAQKRSERPSPCPDGEAVGQGGPGQVQEEVQEERVAGSRMPVFRLAREPFRRLSRPPDQGSPGFLWGHPSAISARREP